MPPIAWVGIVVAVAIAALYLEGWRQRRKLRARGESSSGRPSAMGIGMLEMQKHLQPDRDVKTLVQELKEEDAHPEYRPAREGDDPKEK